MAEELPGDLRDKAERELGETPAVRSAAIADLRTQLQALPPEEQPHRADDAYLLAFLRPQKFRVDAALRKMRALWEFKRQHQAELRDTKAEDFREMLDIGFLRPLLHRDQEGRFIVCMFPARVLGLERFPELLPKWIVFLIEQTGIMFDPYVQVNGMVFVQNQEGLTLSTAVRMRTGPIRPMQDRLFKFMGDACPYRFHGMFIINELIVIDLVLALLRPFMPRKLYERIRLLGRGEKGFKALHALVSPECLPPEFGGTLQEKPGAWLENALLLEREGRMNKLF